MLLINVFPCILALRRKKASAVPHKNVKQAQWYPSTRTHLISVRRASRHKSVLSSGSSVTDEMRCGSFVRHVPAASTDWGTGVFRKALPSRYPRWGTTRVYLFGKGSRLSQLQLSVGGPINPHCTRTGKRKRGLSFFTIIIQFEENYCDVSSLRY